MNLFPQKSNEKPQKSNALNINSTALTEYQSEYSEIYKKWKTTRTEMITKLSTETNVSDSKANEAQRQAEIDGIYFSDNFDKIQHLEKLLSDASESSLSLSHIETKLQTLDKWRNLNERELSTKILKNYKEFVRGIQLIKSIETDMSYSIAKCTENRALLTALRRENVIIPAKILLKIQRKKRLILVKNKLFKLQNILKEENSFHDALNERNYAKSIEISKKIEIHCQNIETKFLCIESLIERQKDFPRNIISALYTEVAAFFTGHVDDSVLPNIFACFSSLPTDLTKKFLSIDFLTLLTKVLNKSFPAERASAGSFMKTYMSLLAHFSKLLYKFHKFHKLYTSPDDSALLTAVLSQLWSEMEQKILQLLSSTEQHNALKTSEVLTILDTGLDFLTIGENLLVGETPVDHVFPLKKILYHKCTEYFDRIHQESFEYLIPSFQMDNWKPLPLHDGFDVLSVKELRFSRVAQEEKNRNSVYETFLMGGNPFETSTSLSERDFDTADTQHVISLLGRVEAPVLTSSALSVVRFLGMYAQTVPAIDFLSTRALDALVELFEFYVFSLFTNFGLYVHSFFMKNSIVEFRYPHLHNFVNSVNKKLREKTFARGIFAVRSVTSPERSPLRKGFRRDKTPESENPVRISSISPEIDVESEDSLYALLERCVAGESLYFVQRSLCWIQQSISQFITEQSAKVDFALFLEQSAQVIDEFNVYLHRNLSARVIDRKSVVEKITATRWDITDMVGESNAYTEEIVKDFTLCREKLSFLEQQKGVSLSERVRVSLWTELVGYTMECLVEGYSRIEKCSSEGRALMSLDYDFLVSAIRRVVGERFIGESHLVVQEYVKAYYLPREDLLQWEYTKEQCIALASSGLVGSEMKKKAKAEFVKDVEEEWTKNEMRKKGKKAFIEKTRKKE